MVLCEDVSRMVCCGSSYSPTLNSLSVKYLARVTVPQVTVGWWWGRYRGVGVGGGGLDLPMVPL